MTATEFDLFEIMRTTRSMRRLKTDPVPKALLRRALEAGTCAASGGNVPSWRFRVIRDQTIKEAAGAWYRKAWHKEVAPRYRSSEPAPGMAPEGFGRMLRRPSIWQIIFTRHRYGLCPVWRDLGNPAPARPSSRQYRTCCWRQGHSASEQR
jgi:nitroreductase